MTESTSSKVVNPLIDDSPQEIPLPNAPLIRVVAQIRFSPVLAMSKADTIAPIQELLAKDFPFLQRTPSQEAVFNEDGNLEYVSQVIWRLLSPDKSWIVSLTTSFVALETTQYKSRQDFIEKLTLVLNALNQHAKPYALERIGLRYIDRLTGEALNNVESFIRPEMLGILATPLKNQAALYLQESLFEVPLEKAALRTRWGLIPPEMTPEPAAIPPVTGESWILDLDVFSTTETEFSSDYIIEKVQAFASRTYTFFRWAVTDEFLKHFGGNP